MTDVYVEKKPLTGYELLNEWIRALRSGRYEQGQRALKDENGGHCCLGVLCDIIDPDAWDHDPLDQTNRWKGKAGYPPFSAWERTGLPSDFQMELARLNDHGAPFVAIAAHIEARRADFPTRASFVVKASE